MSSRSQITSLDLNKTWVQEDEYVSVDYGAFGGKSSDGSVEVYLRNLEEHLIWHIQEAECILGCVAWLTNPRILAAMAEMRNVALVVQKEDFLRPDTDNPRDWKSKLRRMYDKLPGGVYRSDFEGLMESLSFSCDTPMEPVRCVGNYNRDKSPAFPRMHHKFIIFDRREYGTHDFGDGPKECVTTHSPYAVWTGSFNFTDNATRSLENGLYITDPKIVKTYFDEWARVEAISELLDWTSDWVTPEWKIGT